MLRAFDAMQLAIFWLQHATQIVGCKPNYINTNIRNVLNVTTLLLAHQLQPTKQPLNSIEGHETGKETVPIEVHSLTCLAVCSLWMNLVK